ncbi:unnamed protein product [Dracunculus medinensis]|uniref:RING-type domain-containing protein n=1 Tax=Dracunculus medinensis TaxID=318479 RepID=A0A0N4U9R7_DRAME|nr:unnamed protein product [Dracunculus medinensis]
MNEFTRCDMCRARLRAFTLSEDQTTWLFPCLHAFCTTCKAKCIGSNAPSYAICHICKSEFPQSHIWSLPNSSECSAPVNLNFSFFFGGLPRDIKELDCNLCLKSKEIRTGLDLGKAKRSFLEEGATALELLRD